MKILLMVLLVVLLGLFSSTEAKPKNKAAEVKFLNITSTFNPKNSYYFNFAVAPDTNNRKFDIQWNVSVDIPSKVMMKIDVYVGQGKSRNLIFPYEFDFCRIWDGFMSQTFARMWFKNLKRYGKFPTTCPISKGYYFLNKMHMEKGSIPPLLQGGQFFAKVLMYINRETMKDTIFNAELDVVIVKG